MSSPQASPLVVVSMLAGHALWLAGCCAPPLLDERTTEPHAGFLRRGVQLCTTSELVRAEDPGQPPLVMHLRAVRAPDGEPDAPLLVLQPGILADHKTFRFLWPLLGEKYDLLLVDPPGTGRSDKPAVGGLPDDGYTPTWLGRHTLRAVRTWQCHHADTRRLVFVAHSLGSTALVRALADPSTAMEMPALCARVDGLVLIALADVGMTRVAPVFEELEGLSGPVATVADALGILHSRMREGVHETVTAPEQRAFSQEADRLTAILADPDARNAAQAMLRRFRPTTPDEEPDWPAIRAQQWQHRNIRVPVLVLWGAQDETLHPPPAGEITRQLPTAELELVSGSKHSPHQEQPWHCRGRIFQFVERLRRREAATPTPTR